MRESMTNRSRQRCRCTEEDQAQTGDIILQLTLRTELYPVRHLLGGMSEKHTGDPSISQDGAGFAELDDA